MKRVFILWIVLSCSIFFFGHFHQSVAVNTVHHPVSECIEQPSGYNRLSFTQNHFYKGKLSLNGQVKGFFISSVDE